MIISRAPLRISFFGGGTDYLEWFSRHESVIIGAAIDKYSYVTVRNTHPFAEYKTKLSYSKTEIVNDHNDIEHGAIREALKLTGSNQGVEIAYVSDLPSRSGLGSSSSFIVALLNGLGKLNDIPIRKRELADTTNLIERFLLKEPGGFQDPFHAACGGFNEIKFSGISKSSVEPLPMDFANQIEQCSHLYYIGNLRTAAEISASYDIQDDVCRSMIQIAQEAKRYINQNHDILFFQLINKSWQEKKRLSPKVSSQKIDDLINAYHNEGAYCAKLLGAGSGGFLYVAAPPGYSPSIQLPEVPFKFDHEGAKIVYA